MKSAFSIFMDLALWKHYLIELNNLFRNETNRVIVGDLVPEHVISSDPI